MDLQSLANLGEFISGLAVVISLVYLAFQVRQNTQSLRTENYARALDRVAAIQSQLSAHSELSRIFSTGALDPSRLTPQQRIQMTWGLYETFGAFEFMFHAARSHALPDPVWSRWSAAVAWWLTFPGVRSWWQTSRLSSRACSETIPRIPRRLGAGASFSRCDRSEILGIIA